MKLLHLATCLLATVGCLPLDAFLPLPDAGSGAVREGCDPQGLRWELEDSWTPRLDEKAGFGVHDLYVDCHTALLPGGLTITDTEWLESSYFYSLDEAGWSVELELPPTKSVGWGGASGALERDVAFILDRSESPHFLRLFERGETGWSQTGELRDEASFAGRLALSGNTLLAIGGLKGPVIVFERTGDSWARSGTLPSDDVHDLALEGDTAALIADRDLLVFERSAAGWEERWTYPLPEDLSAVTIHLQADTLVLAGAGVAELPGTVMVFHREGGTWEEAQTFVGDHVGASPSFGRSIALHGDTLLVGDGGADDWRGSVRVYARSAGTWAFERELLGVDYGGASVRSFGQGMAIDGERALISCCSVAGSHQTIYVLD